MIKLLRKKKVIVESSSTSEKAVQCNIDGPDVRIRVLQELPKYSSDENFNTYSQRLHLIMKALHIDEKDKVGFLLACLQGKATEELEKSQCIIDGNTTWKEATTMLGKIFDSTQINGNIQALRQAKQTHDQNYGDFIKMVQQMVKSVFHQKLVYSDVDRETETIRYSIRGAKKELKTHLKGSKYNSINDLMAKGQTLEANMIMGKR